jgi:2-iminobutanoate/2-iminopropanoate deaminase
MSREVVRTTNAPPAVASYSQGIIAEGKFVFVSGQVGMDPKTKDLPEGVTAQTERALENMKAILEAANSNLENVVKVTVLLHSIDDYAAMNEVYQRYFSQNPPARAAFGGNDLPLGALVEIECIALVPLVLS